MSCAASFAAECGAVMYGRGAAELASTEVADACLGHRRRLTILNRQV